MRLRFEPSRRSILKAILTSGLTLAAARPGEAKAETLVGAIRWDAWYSPGSVPTTAVANSLAPPEYRWRLPFFSKLDPQSQPPVKLPLASQELLDLEIKQALYAGLDFWAFVGYGLKDSMSSALNLYLTSRDKGSLRFCFFTELARWGNSGRLSSTVDEEISLMARPEYVRVGDQRPLYFLGFIDRRTISSHWGTIELLRSGIEVFRKKCLASGLGNPYIVLCGPFSELQDWTLAGGDAVGAYSIGDPFRTGSYSSLVDLVEQRWSSLRVSGLPVVPTAMAGLDRRPRVEHPVPWEAITTSLDALKAHYDSPTPEELAAHVSRAIQFLEKQPRESRAPAALIYAWNENDEGGWLIPTIPCDTNRLTSLAKVLGSKEAQNPGCSVSR